MVFSKDLSQLWNDADEKYKMVLKEIKEVINK